MSLKETFSCEEEQAIQELQKRMKNNLTPGLRDEKLLYYRFLKARDFDVDKAEKMLRKHIIWRKANQIDNILQDFTPTELFHKFLEPGLIGFDKEGDIVRYSAAGKLSPFDIMKCMTNSYYMKHWFWFDENMIELIEKENERTGRNSYRVVFIFDLDKLTFQNATSRISIDMFLEFIRIVQDNYPERMKASIVINAPTFFVLVFSILKTIMSGAMIRKIHVFGNSGWKEKLLEMIDADVLPAFLGGERTDPDGNPLCTTFITHGGEIPKCYFLSDEDRYFKDLSQVQNITVPSLEKKEVCVEVPDSDSLLQWVFYVKGKDIGFGLYFQTSESNLKEELIAIQKYNTSDGCERDSYKCRSPGNYIAIFDNTYSWMTSKSVQYCFTVAKPHL